MKKWKNAMDSMTKEELENPEVLEKQTSRISRIAKGAGTTSSEIRSLLKQYKMLKELTKGGMPNLEKGLSQKEIMRLAKKFGKKIRM